MMTAAHGATHVPVARPVRPPVAADVLVVAEEQAVLAAASTVARHVKQQRLSM